MFLNVIMTPVVAGNVIKYDQLQEYFLEGKAFRSFRSAERGTSEHFSNGTAEEECERNTSGRNVELKTEERLPPNREEV